jgi:hypothetical protein
MPPFRTNWIQAPLGQCLGEVVDVAGSLGEDKAVSAATGCLHHIGEDLLIAFLIFGKRAVDACDGTRDGQIDRVLQPERGGVDNEHGAGSVGTGAFEGVEVGVSEGVADRAELEADQVVEAVAPVGRGGEPDPAARRDGADGGLERGCRDVVALIDDDLAVGAELVGEVGSAGECLQRGDVDDSGELGSAAAELPRFEAEEVGDLAAPLVRERLAVDQHERGNGSPGDDGTGHDGLPRAGRSDQES